METPYILRGNEESSLDDEVFLKDDEDFPDGFPDSRMETKDEP